jgi:hypothetical protein
MPTTRRRFLGWLGGSSMFAVAAPVAAMSAQENEPSHGAPIQTTWDVSWADRVQGKYRAVFDSPEISEGAALVRAVAWCDHYKDVYGASRADMSPVIVFRHAAIPLVMDDAFWKRFKLGKEAKIRGPGGKKWTEVNPIRAAAPGAPPAAAKYTLEKYVGDGGIILACNWAFGQMVSMLRTADKLDGPTAGERTKAHLVPGVILQPNGIFAALRAQEAGCKYIMAS